MSTPAATDYHHSHSHSHHQGHHSHNHGQPSRSHSTRSGPATSSTAGPPHRSASHHHHGRQSSSATRPVQDVLPQRDYETSNVASKRSSSRDRHAPPVSRGAADSKAVHRRTSTRSSNPHGEMAGPTAVANNAGPAAVPPVMQAAADARATGAKTRTTRTSIPTQSGKWILGKTIGAGSMGKVKLARKEDGTEQVACKIIPRGSTDENHHSRADKERADQSKEIRTAREAAIVTLLDHPNICGLRDVVRTNYHWYMLFEYVNGGQMLDYIISHGKLKDKQARKFSRQIASALDYSHRNSIVHRDLKIENILIAKTGDIKIIDFGLSNLFTPRGHLKTFCGSLYFAAPELLQARAYTGPEVDVWSFGIVLYVLVCGKVPFDDQSMPALHAKIKKGLVDYPGWLSHECRHLLSRMLVTDPKARATMHEVLNHPWMTKGYGGPPENHLPPREPLALPLEPEVINAMTGFNFGPPEVIKAQLTRLIESEEYKKATQLLEKEKELPPPPKDVERKRGVFDFYRRRNSASSRDNLTAPSSEALALGSDPLNAFSPLISIYYLVKEKQDRDKVDVQPKVHTPKNVADSPMPEIVPPQAAHTNTATFEMPGEKATGGRTRARARTHGEDDAPEDIKKAQLSPALPNAPAPDGQLDVPHKKESTAAGILRRFSTRRRKEPERLEKDRSHPPLVHVHSPSESPVPPRKSFSIRRPRARGREDSEGQRLRSGSSQPQHRDLLSPPFSAGDSTSGSKKGLGRSTSVNSADFRRRPFGSANRVAKDAPPTSGSDQSTSEKAPADQKASPTTPSASLRAKSLGHARRESIQARRLKREGARAADVPEETDAEVGEASGGSAERLDDSELAKPVFLKGLFSVSTTSTKSVPAIRTDVKGVLKQLGVDYTEIRGGFSCRHRPSIDLNKVADGPASPGAPAGHRRRISFGIRSERERDEFRESERLPATPRTPGKGPADKSDSNSEISEEDSVRYAGGSSRRVPGETTTQVQSDLGGSMVLEFEIFIVKVPLLSLHGLQFKRMTGNTWQFKNMADHILKELRL
ncbi:hypothetical protein BJ170DRAFT_700774 [Xylariales sp. AK1849]|nr:hypothetical protein BJ170DRAFT_700774 [Xylariales sp. AK1849]